MIFDFWDITLATHNRPLETDSKAVWRQWAKGQRQTLNMPELGHGIVAALTAWEREFPVETVLLFYPLAGEIDLSPLLEVWPEKSFYLPTVDDSETLSFYRVSANDWPTLRPRGSFQIPEPEKIQSYRYQPNQTLSAQTLVIVPALAVDGAGYRLGYGKGFYDRFLPGLPAQAHTIMTVMPSSLCVPQLPRDTWDVPVHWVATELGISKIDPRLGS